MPLGAAKRVVGVEVGDATDPQEIVGVQVDLLSKDGLVPEQGVERPVNRHVDVEVESAELVDREDPEEIQSLNHRRQSFVERDPPRGAPGVDEILDVDVVK